MQNWYAQRHEAYATLEHISLSHESVCDSFVEKVPSLPAVSDVLQGCHVLRLWILSRRGFVSCVCSGSADGSNDDDNAR